MVQYNFPALTNSNVFIKDGGVSGQTVWAVNNTNEDIVEGKKVWLNVNETDQVYVYTPFRLHVNYQFAENFIRDNVPFANNSMYIWNGNGYNGISLTSTGNAFSDQKPFRIEKGYVFQMGYNTSLDKNNNVKIFDWGQNSIYTSLMNEKFVCYEQQRGSARYQEIHAYDYNSGIKDDTILFEWSGTSGYYNPIGFIGKNKVALSFISKNGIRIYNDITAATKTYTDYVTPLPFCAVWYSDEDNVGSYVIGTEEKGEYFKYSNNTAWAIYRFNTDGYLEVPDDLPASLRSWLHLGNVCFTFNTDDGILCAIKIGDKKYGAWRIVDGVFIDIPLPPYIDREPGNYRYNYKQSFCISSDLKTLMIAKNTQYSDIYNRVDIFRYNDMDGKWYAAGPDWKDSNTLTGFATGEVNSEGLYEIATVLPAPVTLTFNITPDEDSIEFKGAQR